MGIGKHYFRIQYGITITKLTAYASNCIHLVEYMTLYIPYESFT